MNPKENRLIKSDETKAYCGEFPADLCDGKHLIFIYTNIIEYQNVGDTKEPLLRVNDSKQPLKNGSLCELEPTHRIVFTNLVYKKLLTNTFQSTSIELRTEAGLLVPFRELKKLFKYYNSKNFPKKLDSYYASQATFLSLFSGHYRQRGSDYGALAAGIGRVSLPLARRFILPTAKRIGKELLKQSVPEILDAVGNKKSPKQAFKYTISKTVKKQTGGSRRITSRRRQANESERKT